MWDDWGMSRSDTREAMRPLAGTLWAWEPESEHAAALIRVTAVHWNGEEWFVGAEVLAENPRPAIGRPTMGRGVFWNDLDRFWEACHRVHVKPGPRSGRGVTRRGDPQPDEVGAMT